MSENQTYRMELSNGALIHFPTSSPAHADVTITLSRPNLLALLATATPNGAGIDGNENVLAKLISLLDAPIPEFAVVTP
ncbi:MAG: alkyl sulfatase C-terminal domain-containing protein [Frankiaceae bacterium]